MNNYNISKWNGIFNKIIYGWDLNLINTDYSLCIDTSHWDEPKKLDEVKFSRFIEQYNVKALIFKVSDANKSTGVQYYDDTAEDWYKIAKKYKLLTSGYHWLQPIVDPKVGFNFYNSWIKDHPFDLPKIVDWEEPSVTNAKDYLWRLQTFLELSGKDSIIYTGTGFISNMKAKISTANYDDCFGFMKNYPLWVAWYSRYKPANLYPWTDWQIWQYSDVADFPFYKDEDNLFAQVWGFNGSGLDISWIKNSYLQLFIDKANNTAPSGSIIPPVPQEPSVPPVSLTSYKYKNVSGNNMNIRSGPSVGSAIVGSLPTDSIVEGLDFTGNDCWTKIGDKQYVAIQQGTKTYLQKQ